MMKMQGKGMEILFKLVQIKDLRLRDKIIEKFRPELLHCAILAEMNTIDLAEYFEVSYTTINNQANGKTCLTWAQFLAYISIFVYYIESHNTIKAKDLYMVLEDTIISMLPKN